MLDMTTLVNPVEKANDIISHLISKTEHILRDDDDYKEFLKTKKDFRSLKIYGSINKPLFMVAHVYSYLYPDKPYDKNNKKSFKKKFLEGKEKVEAVALVPQGVKGSSDKINYIHRKVWMLTKLGLLKSMFILDTGLTITFRDFILELLDNLHENQQEVMAIETEKAFVKYKLIHELERKKLREEQEESARLLAKSGKCITEQKQSIDRLEVANFTNNINYKKLEHIEQFTKIEDLSDSKSSELATLRELHMRKIPVYLVSPDHIAAAKLKKTEAETARVKKAAAQQDKKPPRRRGQHLPEATALESESDSDIEEYFHTKKPRAKAFAPTTTTTQDFAYEDLDLDVDYDQPLECYTERDLSQEYRDDNLYYHIPGFNSKVEMANKSYYITFHLYLYNAEHYKAMMAILTQDDESQTAARGVLKVTYNNIISARNTSFANSDFATIFGGVSQKTTRVKERKSPQITNRDQKARAAANPPRFKSTVKQAYSKF